MKGFKQPDGTYKHDLMNFVRYLETVAKAIGDSGRTYIASGADIVGQGFTLELDAYADDHHSHCSEIIIVEPERPPA